MNRSAVSAPRWGKECRLFLERSSLTRLTQRGKVSMRRVYGVCRISSLRQSCWGTSSSRETTCLCSLVLAIFIIIIK